MEFKTASDNCAQTADACTQYLEKQGLTPIPGHLNNLGNPSSYAPTHVVYNSRPGSSA